MATGTTPRSISYLGASTHYHKALFLLFDQRHLCSILSFDTTGSMSAYIDEVKTKVDSIVGELLRDVPGIFQLFCLSQLSGHSLTHC